MPNIKKTKRAPKPAPVNYENDEVIEDPEDPEIEASEEEDPEVVAEVAMVEVELINGNHTHAGVPLEVGDKFTIPESQAEVLEKKGVVAR